MILSVTLRSLYALVSHLCLTGLPKVAMPHSDMWQDCQITFPHTRPNRAIGRPTPDPTWKRPPGRPRTKWTDQLRRDNNNVPIATLWRQAVTRERRYGPSRLRVNDDDGELRRSTAVVSVTVSVKLCLQRDFIRRVN